MNEWKKEGRNKWLNELPSQYVCPWEGHRTGQRTSQQVSIRSGLLKKKSRWRKEGRNKWLNELMNYRVGMFVLEKVIALVSEHPNKWVYVVVC